MIFSLKVHVIYILTQPLFLFLCWLISMFLKKIDVCNWILTRLISNSLPRRYFSSNSFQITVQNDDIELYLQQRQVKVFNGWTCYQCSNPFSKCSLSHENVQPNDFNNYYVNKTTGEFFCPLTGHHGSWKSLKKLIETPFNSRVQVDFSKFCSDQNDNVVEDLISNSLLLIDIDFQILNNLLDEYKIKVLPLKHLTFYDLRYKLDTKQLLIPYYDSTKQNKVVKGIKLIKSPQYFNHELGNKSSFYDLTPEISQFFGLKNSYFDRKQIVLTENEFDAIAINVFSKRYKAISVPHGAISLPLRLLPYLESFSQIILWFESNILSSEAVQMFSKKLIPKRCLTVKPPKYAPTALAAARHNIDIDEIISSAISTDIQNLETIDDLYDEIKTAFLDKDKYAGTPYKRFWNLNKKLKGHRSGELTVLTGSTGSGKTTLLSELSLELAVQGVKTLWGSFEISNKRLLMCMLKQFSRTSIENNMDKFDEIGSQFRQLPLMFMTYSGSKSVEDVIKTMFEATYCYDIKHIIIDNLQFMIGNLSKVDRFAYQDYAVSQFREFASKYNVHITLVVHPRKEDNFMPLQMSSVFGSAKVTQEADNVLILQVKQTTDSASYPLKYLEVVKNRYDGELGRMRLYFNQETLCMSPPPQYNDALKDSKNEQLAPAKSALNEQHKTNKDEKTSSTYETSELCSKSQQTERNRKINANNELTWISQFRKPNTSS